MVAIDIGTFFDTVLAWLQNTWTSLCADFYLNFIKEDRWKSRCLQRLPALSWALCLPSSAPRRIKPAGCAF